MRPDAVAVVVTCYNLGRTLAEAIDSVLGQTVPAAELVIVDDGSQDLYTLQELGRHERAGRRVVRTENRGVSAARNTGVRLTSAPRIVLLDGDDVLDERYLEKLGAHLDRNPALDYVSCAQQAFGASSYVWCPPEPRIPDSIIRGVVHASSMFRRAVWETVGGFDETVPGMEILDFWTSVLEHGFRGAVLDEPLLCYRVRHDSQYHAIISPEANDACMCAFYQKHWHTIAAHAEEMFVGKESFLLEQYAHHTHVLHQTELARRELALLRDEIARLHAELETLRRPAVDLGDLRRTCPLSATWGLDRGKPLDRYYIEAFLDRHREDVRGRVLEVKDAHYTRVYGDQRVTASDVLDVDERNEQATIHADLAFAGSIPDCTYDAFILTQTLGLIFDVGAAIRQACRILKPGGVLLCTVPAAGRISHEGDGLDGDFWRFTEASIRRLFAEAFPIDSVEVVGFGNVLACTAFLYGLAAHELAAEELEIADPYLPLVYGVRAVKPQADSAKAASRHSSADPGGAARRNAGAMASRNAVGRAVILAYHRVGDFLQSGSRPIPLEAFRAQMAIVRRTFNPLSLDDLAQAAHEGRLPERAVAVTFDDGYGDVLSAAAPVLVENQIPATAFVTSQGSERCPEFYWDLLGRVFGNGLALPPELHLPGLGIDHVATSTDAERAEARRRLNELFYAIGGEARASLSAHLRSWSEALGASGEPNLLTEDDIRHLSAVPGLSIGAHSRHHLCLPLHDEETQRQDVLDNKRWLEGLTGYAVTDFAYPYGERNQTTVRVLRELGFRNAVTVDGIAVEDGCSRLLLPRCEVLTTDISAFTGWLRGLLTSET
jgi:peptidoglycan/xylan/chitin deacetylase (PgdA/CDA1 family)/glycosyltransferase involved in cell wall biosynthesis